MKPFRVVLTLLLFGLAACSDTDSSGTTNVQGGNSRAPGAPQIQATARPTNTVTR